MSENLSRKKHDEEIIIKRYASTAFFYSEYILRHYELKYPYLLNFANIILAFIEKKYKCTQNTAINILDRLIEMKSGTDDVNFYCSISKNAIIKRFIKGCQNLKLNPSDFSILYEDLLLNDLEECLHELINESLNNGVYLSHLTNYRINNYNFDIFKFKNNDELTKHIFFKKDFLICGDEPYVDVYNNKKIDLESYIDNLHNTENQPQELVLELIISPNHKDFSIKNVSTLMSAILLAHLHTEIHDALKDNSASSSKFMKIFFRRTIHKPIERELQNRLLGLLLWDIQNFENSKKTLFSIYLEDFIEKYKFKYITQDAENKCYEACDSCKSAECMKNISIIVNHTHLSIENKTIHTR